MLLWSIIFILILGPLGAPLLSVFIVECHVTSVTHIWHSCLVSIIHTVGIYSRPVGYGVSIYE